MRPERSTSWRPLTIEKPSTKLHPFSLSSPRIRNVSANLSVFLGILFCCPYPTVFQPFCISIVSAKERLNELTEYSSSSFDFSFFSPALFLIMAARAIVECYYNALRPPSFKALNYKCLIMIYLLSNLF